MLDDLTLLRDILAQARRLTIDAATIFAKLDSYGAFSLRCLHLYLTRVAHSYLFTVHLTMRVHRCAAAAAAAIITRAGAKKALEAQDADEAVTATDKSGRWLKRRMKARKAKALEAAASSGAPADANWSFGDAITAAPLHSKAPAPVPYWTLQDMCRDAARLPVTLPFVAAFQSRLQHVHGLVARIREVFPFPGSHARTAAGGRLPQGIGLGLEKAVNLVTGDDAPSAAIPMPDKGECTVARSTHSCCRARRCDPRAPLSPDRLGWLVPRRRSVRRGRRWHAEQCSRDGSLRLRDVHGRLGAAVLPQQQSCD